jgi:hypothetical protein
VIVQHAGDAFASTTFSFRPEKLCGNAFLSIVQESEKAQQTKGVAEVVAVMEVFFNPQQPGMLQMSKELDRYYAIKKLLIV